MIRKLLPFVAVLAAAPSIFGQSAQQVELAREKIQKWVETRQTISKERSEWRTQEETLNYTKDLLAQELEDLESRLAELGDSESVADQERAKLTAQKNELDAATESVKAAVADMEVKLKALIDSFPPKFVELIDPLVRRLPEDPYRPGNLSLGQRLANVVGILQQASKFNQTIHFVNDTVEYDGKLIQVDMVYWGLGMAYFVDQNNTYAGIKYASSNGWQTDVLTDQAETIRLLIDNYQRKTSQPTYVGVPVKIN